MVNERKVEGMLRNLQRYLSLLHEIAETERSAFLSDSVTAGAAKYYLQIAIETCLNLGNHIIASERYRPPRDYRDVFTVLNENGVLPDDFTRRLRQMSGLRNRLVHIYWEIEDEQIYEYLQADMGDFDRFVGYIERFIAES